MVRVNYDDGTSEFLNFPLATPDVVILAAAKVILDARAASVVQSVKAAKIAQLVELKIAQLNLLALCTAEINTEDNQSNQSNQ